jgi:hypothetical protein
LRRELEEDSIRVVDVRPGARTRRCPCRSRCTRASPGRRARRNGPQCIRAPVPRGEFSCAAGDAHGSWADRHDEGPFREGLQNSPIPDVRRVFACSFRLFRNKCAPKTMRRRR